nr:tRNA lysidine(34) synthetase TilS [Brevibacterium daeguense]
MRELLPATPARFVVAVSGGADSMALAAACAFFAERTAHRFTAVTVDHGLQPGSDSVAAAVGVRVRDLGLAHRVVARTVEPGTAGVEAAARDVRYRALEEAREELGAVAVLTGHTRDDQAETVLLGLVRGSGARSLAGMRPRSGTVWRPLLDVRREETAASCAARGIAVWHDPMNADPQFTRVRVRTRVLPVLEEQLGPGVATALARTASRLAQDSDALEELAVRQSAAHVSGTEIRAAVRELPAALRTRMIRDWLRDLSGTAQEVGFHHVSEVDALLCGRRSGAVSVPGGAEVRRAAGGGVRFHRS